MEFPLNKLKLDVSYISAVEDEAESNILAQYTAFKNGSTALVMSFRKIKAEYGSTQNIPRDVLQKYSSALGSLLDISKNLRKDLQRQVNKNTRDLVYIRDQGDEESFINTKALKKREMLYQKIEYFDDIEILYMVLEFSLEIND